MERLILYRRWINRGDIWDEWTPNITTTFTNITTTFSRREIRRLLKLSYIIEWKII